MLKHRAPLVVEVPLDSEFLTEDGFYEAGYRWGQYIRSANDPDVQRQPQAFIDGVKDGYGDKMRELEGKMKHPAAEPVEDATTAKELAWIGDAYRAGQITYAQYTDSLHHMVQRTHKRNTHQADKEWRS